MHQERRCSVHSRLIFTDVVTAATGGSGARERALQWGELSHQPQQIRFIYFTQTQT